MSEGLHQNHVTHTLKGKGESVQDFKKRMMEKKRMEDAGLAETSGDLQDEYEQSMLCEKMIRKRTGLVYDDSMTKHRCEWDHGYPECPERYTAIMARFKELGLDQCCLKVEIEDFKHEDILRKHSVEHIKKLERICTDFDMVKAEKIASDYDAIYFNEHSYSCALTANNAVLSLVKAVAEGSIHNGMAVVRPPGHHAQHKEYNGYCFFNNVAIAAEYLKQQHASNVGKVLIVDFDVHHGQGTQKMFYNDNKVLYFSIHRYEHGSFWPNLQESNFDHIGEAPGTGFNINFPLNSTGCGDSEYLAIVTNILLPVAYEFQPDMILFSAGYDACIGCPEGEMEVSPGFYGHLITLLSGLAQGRLAVVLEGGYFLDSLAEGAAMTLRALLDHRPAVLSPVAHVRDEVASTINDLKFTLHKYWKCFEHLRRVQSKADKLHVVEVKYLGTPPVAPFDTRNCYPVQSESDIRRFKAKVEEYRKGYGLPKPNSVCYGYSDAMKKHAPPRDAIENPKRLTAVYERFLELQLNSRCAKVEKQIPNITDIYKRTHDANYIAQMTDANVAKHFSSADMYFDNEFSTQAIDKAVETLLVVTDEVMEGGCSSGVAIIRPPGHHAEANEAMGFCFVNNVAIAAQYAIDKYHLERVMIIDIDIHHGNGTQKLFYDTNKVLYLSLHRYDSGRFFPYQTSAGSSHHGSGKGAGHNVNVAFSSGKMGDTEYLTAFFRIVLPVAYSYAPELVIVSAGFDAGIYDRLGNYKVLPETFGHMIQLLKPLAGGRLVLAMEGGYNLNTLKHSMGFCVKTLLGDPLPKLSRIGEVNIDAHKAFEETIAVHKTFWPVFTIDKSLVLDDINHVSGV